MNYLLNQLLNGLSLGCVYALIALGFAMVYGILRLLNFAHAEVFTAGAFAGYGVLTRLAPGVGPAAVMLALLAAGAASGALAVLIERVAYRPLRHLPRVSVLLTAIGVSTVLQIAGLRLFGAQPRVYPVAELPVAPRGFAVGVLLATVVLLRVLLFRTSVGIQIRAVSDNFELARLMGVSADRVVAATFFIGGFFAGVGGVVWGVMYGSVHPQMGFVPGLKAFIIAVVGSIGSLYGTLAIGVLLGVAEVLYAAYLPSELSGYRDLLVLGSLGLLLVLRPSGLAAVNPLDRV